MASNAVAVHTSVKPLTNVSPLGATTSTSPNPALPRADGDNDGTPISTHTNAASTLHIITLQAPPSATFLSATLPTEILLSRVGEDSRPLPLRDVGVQATSRSKSWTQVP